MSASLQFDVKALKEKGSVALAAEVPPGDLQESLSGQALLAGPVRVGLEFYVQGGGVGFRGQAEGDWELECARCLARKTFPFAAKVEGAGEPGQYHLDVSDEIRQALLLSVPMRAYCRPDCKGLCPRCRADLNVKDCGCGTQVPSAFRITRRKDA